MKTREFSRRVDEMGPILRLITPALIGVIGTLIISNLNAINVNSAKVEQRLDKHISKIESYMEWTTTHINNNDKRITVIEAIANDKSRFITDEEFRDKLKNAYEKKGVFN